MPDFQYGSYCGLYCGACDIMHQFKKGQQTGTSPRWEDLPSAMQKHLPVPKDAPIVCYGCKSDDVFYGCSKCPIRACARGRANIDNCTECEKYPCLKFRVRAFILRFLGGYKKLPHLLVVNSNLKEIENYGMVNWLKNQQQEWSCTRCHAELTWYTKDNHQCSE